MSDDNNSSNPQTQLMNNVHPLQLDAVVERLFTFLDKEDLRQCLGVCRLWNHEARRAIDNRQSRTIVTEVDLYVTLGLLKIKQYTLTKLVIDNRAIPLVRDRLSLDSKPFAVLFKEVAPTLLSLSLQYVQCSQDVYTNIIRLFGKYNWLRHLELGTLKINEEDYVKLFPVKKEGSEEFVVFTKVRFLEYMDYSTYLYNRTNVACLVSTVGRMFPNLTQLNSFCLAKEKPSNFDNIKFPQLRGLLLVMHGNDAPDQKATGLTNVGVKCLMNMGLSGLEDFSLLNIVPQCTMLRDFLESTAATLKRLTLIQTLMLALPFPGVAYRLSSEILPSPFPTHLPNLKTLHVTKSFIRNFNHLLSSAPALENLYIDFEFGQKVGTILPTKLELHPPSTLKQLGFNWIDAKTFLKLTPFFVNIVTSLELIDCYDDVVKVVFENFHGLKYLVLAQKSVGYGVTALTDEPFTGLTHTSMKSLYCSWFGTDVKEAKMTTEKMKEVENVRSGACLANVPKLEVLVIRLVEPSEVHYWTFWPFWELRFLSTVVISGLQITKPIVHFMNVGGGFICTGPYDDLVQDMVGCGLALKFLEGDVKTYTFVRKVDHQLNEDAVEPLEQDGTNKKMEADAINELYDTLSDFGSSASIDFSTTILPGGISKLRSCAKEGLHNHK